MKKVLFLLSFLVVSATVVNAQNAGARADKREQRGDKARQGANDLGLSEDQKKQLKDLRAAEKGRLQAIKNDQNLSKEQKKAQAEAIRAEQKAKVKNILTPEQYAKMEAKRAEMKAQRGKGKGAGKGKGKGRKPAKNDNDDDNDMDGLDD